ncbi:MAG: acetyl-CoA acetyltransferase, partial [Hyphomicrobiales bacterium]|nr:acetyl-CoA acetyltransferase [Hyphomicrobiales bacterium]
KHGIGLYSNEPYEGDWKREDPKNYQNDIDLMTKPEVDEKPSGDGKIETYTVANGRNGPELGIVIGRLDSTNARFIAVTQKESDLEYLISQECIGRDCSVNQAEGDYSIVNIK